MKEKKKNYLAINKTGVSIKWLTIASLVYLLIYTEAGDIVTALAAMTNNLCLIPVAQEV